MFLLLLSKDFYKSIHSFPYKMSKILKRYLYINITLRKMLVDAFYIIIMLIPAVKEVYYAI